MDDNAEYVECSICGREGPEYLIEDCSQCGKPCCPDCGEGYAGEWVCDDCAEELYW